MALQCEKARERPGRGPVSDNRVGWRVNKDNQRNKQENSEKSTSSGRQEYVKYRRSSLLITFKDGAARTGGGRARGEGEGEDFLKILLEILITFTVDGGFSETLGRK